MKKNWQKQRDSIIGLGDNSVKKSYYPDLQRKIAELEGVNRNLETLFNSTDEGVIIHRLSGQIIRMSKQALVLFKVEDAELPLFFDILKGMWEKQDLEKTWSEVLKGKHETLTGELLYDNNSAPCFIELSITAALWDQETVLVTLAKDVSEKKQYELELENHRNNLEKAVAERTKELQLALQNWKKTSEELAHKNNIINYKNNELKSTLDNLKKTQAKLVETDKMASLGILTAGVAHEISNPLNFIVSGCMGIQSFLESGNLINDEAEVYMDSINTGIKRVTDIVKSLNQFSRGTESFDETCNIHEILENCIGMLRYKMKGRIELERNYTDRLFQIKGNVGKLHQVFLNVLNNAVQAIENKGDIKIKTELLPDSAIVQLTDTGGGISQENLSKIIDPFFTTKPPGEGTGLGLSITYKIIQEHSGDISFRSEEGQGTTVEIVFPRSVFIQDRESRS